MSKIHFCFFFLGFHPIYHSCSFIFFINCWGGWIKCNIVK
uniref:VP1.4 n=1 Tax=Lychas mucronatus TaxID=172552 RepID=A0A0U1TYJ2_LYCMC|nr:VP1.4 [Lychas mucronatus]